MNLAIVTTCRSAGRLLVEGTVAEVADDEGQRLLELGLGRHPTADDAPAPEPEPTPADPLEVAHAQRVHWRGGTSWENRTCQLEGLVDELLARVAALEASR